MQRFFADDHWLLRLDRGEDVLATLHDFARSHGIGHASISGIGAIEEVEIGAYDLGSKQYPRHRLEGGYEVLSLNGNLAWVGDDPFAHLHVVLGDLDGKCVGGHLFAAKVHITLELFVRASRERVQREVHDEIGLHLWSLPGPDRAGVQRDRARRQDAHEQSQES